MGFSMDAYKKGGSTKGKERGQAIVEFALVSTLFILLLLGTFDAARLLLRYHQLTQIAREGARRASLTPNAATEGSNAVFDLMDQVRVALNIPLGGGVYQIQAINTGGTPAADIVQVTVSQTFAAAFGVSIIPGFAAFNMQPRVTMPVFAAVAPGIAAR